jgi:hypothetical protein
MAQLLLHLDFVQAVTVSVAVGTLFYIACIPLTRSLYPPEFLRSHSFCQYGYLFVDCTSLSPNTLFDLYTCI